MKRIFYVSRFARPLSRRDIERIQKSAARFNHRHGITGILVCLGDTFFQVLEGERRVIDRLYYERIVPDDRHGDVICLKSESGFAARLFPEWDMQVFNLNEEAEVLPMAFRQMLSALLESSYTLAQYTQPSVSRMLENGINPTTIKPGRKRVTVLFSDIVGFSLFAERLKPAELIGLVNTHADICTKWVNRCGGQVNKLLGDGVLAYFVDRDTDAAVASAIGILDELAQRRASAPANSPHRLLFGGVGLSNGMVYEGNVGTELKRDFTILGNTVNQASRLESLTRKLDVRIILSGTVVKRADPSRYFRSLGKHRLKGQSRALEIFTLAGSLPLNIEQLYADIAQLLRNVRF